MTAKTQSHSPLPWIIYKCSYCDDDKACGFNGKTLDHCWDECHHPLTKEDAEFIVLACNHHYQLKAQVERLREALKRAHIHLGILTGRMHRCNETTGMHGLMEESYSFVDEAKQALNKNDT